MNSGTVQDLKDKLPELDPDDMWGAVAGFHRQLEQAAEITLPDSDIQLEKVQNILFCGMGGSAIGGNLVQAYFSDELKVPMQVNRNYTIPGFVDEKSLVIMSSYSGNTEETLSAYDYASKAGAQIFGISSNGEITRKLQQSGAAVIAIPGGMQPRAALGYSFIPMVRMFKKIGLVNRDIESDITETIQLVSDLQDRYSKDADDNLAFSLAKNIPGKVPIIYTAPELEVAGIRWKGQLAENAQMLAFTNTLPEMNHNEIMGWDQQPEFLSQTELFWMQDITTHEQVQKRIEITADLLKQYPERMHILETRGKSWMARLFSLIVLGDWVSLYAALNQGLDPTKIERISLLKDRLS